MLSNTDYRATSITWGARSGTGIIIPKMQLTPEAAAHYFEIGAFIVVADLPKGSEVGIDGE